MDFWLKIGRLLHGIMQQSLFLYKKSKIKWKSQITFVTLHIIL